MQGVSELVHIGGVNWFTVDGGAYGGEAEGPLRIRCARQDKRCILHSMICTEARED
jgi:hypothetical protein